MLRFRHATLDPAIKNPTQSSNSNQLAEHPFTGPRPVTFQATALLRPRLVPGKSVSMTVGQICQESRSS